MNKYIFCEQISTYFANKLVHFLRTSTFSANKYKYCEQKYKYCEQVQILQTSEHPATDLIHSRVKSSDARTKYFGWDGRFGWSCKAGQRLDLLGVELFSRKRQLLGRELLGHSGGYGRDYAGRKPP